MGTNKLQAYLMEQVLHGDAQEISGGQSGICSTALGACILPRRIHDHTVEALLGAICGRGKAVNEGHDRAIRRCHKVHNPSHRRFARTSQDICKL